jgi:hypothetical protein
VTDPGLIARAASLRRLIRSRADVTDDNSGAIDQG